MALDASIKPANYPAGTEREAPLQRARVNETGGHLFDWLTSPGLQPPH